MIPAMRIEGGIIRLAAFLWLGVCVSVGTITGCGGPSTGSVGTVDGKATPSFVGRATCASCHEEEVAAWTGSHHDLAMDRATPASVLADFDDATFENCGVTTRFFTRDGQFYVRTSGRDGHAADHEVTHTFGVEPLQQYLVTFPDGRLQALTIAWDVGERRWFSLHEDECVPPGDPLHWTGPSMNWNYMCADCHSTGVERNFDLATNSYETRYAEIDVSCEACHGPGEYHVAWAREERVPQTRGRRGLTVDLAASDAPANEINTCAPCHSRRRPAFPGHIAGDAFLDHYEPALIEEGVYFSDGQINDEVFVLGSFLQSRMHAEGVRCSNCHEPHSTRTRLAGNALCTQCHLPDTYDVPEHLRHEPDTEASRCISCHMPARTYMVVDPRRDHSFKVPRPDLTETLGVPNACSGCHLDRSATWAADAVVRWYGDERSASAAFAPIFASAWSGDPGAERGLAELVLGARSPDFVRASALRLLRAYESDSARAAAQRALADSSALVRLEAVRAAEYYAADEYVDDLAPLLSDPYRTVRMETARVLSGVRSRSLLRATDLDAFNLALSEFRIAQAALADQPAAHLNLGVVHEQMEEWDDALQAYENAVRLDSSFVPALLNLAMVQDAMRIRSASRGNREVADSLFASTEGALRRALKVDPGSPEAHYSLGLLLAERPARLEEAAAHLEAATEGDPRNARRRYNAGLAWQHLGKPDRAEHHFLAALALEPDNADFLNALSILYLQQGRWADARVPTDQLARLRPDDPEVAQRVRFLEGRQ